jgi:hypothetical protein
LESLQSTLPPPWLPANVGIDKTIKADTKEANTIFMIMLSKKED